MSSAITLAFCIALQVSGTEEPVKPKAKAPAKPMPTKQIQFKQVGDVKLHLHVFEPKGHKAEARRPAIVFFFGGGWVGGSPGQFYPQCQHLADQGVIAISAEYRVKSRNKTTPFECVKDGKSAMRYVRSHASKLGIDPNRIAAGGGSAGGHVAAATGTVPGVNEEGEDTSVSCVPCAMVLFNPVYDNGPGGYGYQKLKDRYKEISPLHNISKKTPPTIVFLGTKDKLIPVATGEKFRDKMKSLRIPSELILFKDRGHGFFNQNKGDGNDYRKTLREMDRFLRQVRFIRD